MVTLVIIICAICIIVIGLNLTMMLFSSFYKKWSVVNGELIEMKLKRNTYPTKQPASEGPILRCTYLINIKYMYQVGDKKYFSSRLNFDLIDKEYENEVIANNEIANIVSGNIIPVYYNKLFPFISVVMPSKTGVTANVITISICICVIVGMIYVVI